MTDPIKIPLLNAKSDGSPVTHNDLPAAPGIANPAHVNHVANFFKAIGHDIVSTVVWAPKVAEKSIQLIEEAEKLSPEFLHGLKSLIGDVAAITGNAALAAASKGANVASDYAVLTGIEKLAGDFNKFYPVLVKDFKEFEGIIETPAPKPEPLPINTTVIDSTAETAMKLNEALTPASKPAIFTPKV